MATAIGRHRRTFLTAWFVTCLAASALPQQAGRRLGIGLSGGIISPLHGRIDDLRGIDMQAVTRTGPVFGLEVRYRVIPELTLTAGFASSYLKSKDKSLAPDTAFSFFDKTDTAPDPVFFLPQITAGANFNLGPFLENGKLNPFGGGGIGLYPWKITRNGVNGEPQRSAFLPSTPFRKFSLGFFGRVGGEYELSSKFSLLAQGSYNFVFTKSSNRFGLDFKNQRLLQFTGGAVYYFSL